MDERLMIDKILVNEAARRLRRFNFSLKMKDMDKNENEMKNIKKMRRFFVDNADYDYLSFLPWLETTVSCQINTLRLKELKTYYEIHAFLIKYAYLIHENLQFVSLDFDDDTLIFTMTWELTDGWLSEIKNDINFRNN